MGSKLVFGVRKLIPKRQEDLAGFDLVSLNFEEAYAELRRVCPRGDLRIHLSVEADTAEEVGAVFEAETWAEHMARCATCRPHLGHVPVGLCPEGMKIFLDQRIDP